MTNNIADISEELDQKIRRIAESFDLCDKDAERVYEMAQKAIALDVITNDNHDNIWGLVSDIGLDFDFGSIEYLAVNGVRTGFERLGGLSLYDPNEIWSAQAPDFIKSQYKSQCYQQVRSKY